jgi:TPP-dependent pyruvate/acetoin dehydrogenase alpha subunit
MAFDRYELYRQMLRSRLFEQAVQRLWEAGDIGGEMHLSLGEEGIAAGVVSALEDGDAMALEHRATAPLVMRGVSLDALLAEFLGRDDGCRASRATYCFHPGASCRSAREWAFATAPAVSDRSSRWSRVLPCAVT